jgi:pimeloyl-ACP methyl ester carboxylesterase
LANGASKEKGHHIMAVDAAVTPFTVDVDQAALDDLQHRLERVRLPIDFDNDDWGYGTNTAYLRELLDYWRDGFDWRAQERAINAYPNFRTTLHGDVPIHFLHIRGKGPDPLPLILSHGWPWTFWDFRKVIGPLTDPAAHGGSPDDAFDVVIPSLPGFGFSTPVTRPVNWIETADMFAELMRDVLGYDRFVAAGADWGNGITGQLGHKYAEHVAGIHVVGGQPLDLWNAREPWGLLSQVPLGEAPEEQERVLAWKRRFAAHLSVQVLAPQTLAVGAHDSPAALTAWLLEKRRAWSDCDGDVERRFDKDDLLTTMMLYWATEGFVSSVRYYRDATLTRWQPSHAGSPTVGVPTAVSVFRADVAHVPPEEYLSTLYNLQQYRVHDQGGHYAHAEEPDIVVTDLRDAFRSLR